MSIALVASRKKGNWEAVRGVWPTPSPALIPYQGISAVHSGFYKANLYVADLTGADFRRADLGGANLEEAKLMGADLSGADLAYASLVEADITNADLTGCRVYGVSAWGPKINDETRQRNLILTKTRGEPEITVDNIDVAQFVYLTAQQCENPRRYRHNRQEGRVAPRAVH
jgi:hypothetical protein